MTYNLLPYLQETAISHTQTVFKTVLNIRLIMNIDSTYDFIYVSKDLHKIFFLVIDPIFAISENKS